jgi:hypothetical protein
MTDRANDGRDLEMEKLFNPHVTPHEEERERKEVPPVEFDNDPMVTRPWAPRSAEEGSDVDPAGRPMRSSS